LLSTNDSDLKFATAAAAAAELELQHVTVAKEAADVMANSTLQAIFVDCSTEKLYLEFEAALQSTIGLFSDRINTNNIHFLTSDGIEKTRYFVQSPLFGNFIMRNTGNEAISGEYYGRILKSCALPTKGFGLAPLLRPNAKIQVVKLVQTTQKQQAVEAVKNFFMAVKFQSRMATIIANAVDEILMNAMFDAPVDDLGRPLYLNLARTTAIELSGKNAIEMHVGFDGHTAAVSAIDFFGSLDKAKLLAHISKIYTNEEYKVRSSVAGAGIGLATVFRAGGSFLFVSESQVKTEVTVFFKKTNNFLEFKDQFRFLSTQFHF